MPRNTTCGSEEVVARAPDTTSNGNCTKGEESLSDRSSRLAMVTASLVLRGKRMLVLRGKGRRAMWERGRLEKRR